MECFNTDIFVETDPEDVLLFSALSPAGASITFSHPEWLDTMVAEAEAKIQDRKQTKEMQLQTIKRIREEQQAKVANQAGPEIQAGQAKQPGQGTQAGQKNPEKPKPAKGKM